MEVLETSAAGEEQPRTPALRPEVEIIQADEAPRLGLWPAGRSALWVAMSPRLSAARGWPVLPSFKLGSRRMIRVAAIRTWIAEVEARSQTQAAPEPARSPAPQVSEEPGRTRLGGSHRGRRRAPKRRGSA